MRSERSFSPIDDAGDGAAAKAHDDGVSGAPETDENLARSLAFSVAVHAMWVLTLVSVGPVAVERPRPPSVTARFEIELVAPADGVASETVPPIATPLPPEVSMRRARRTRPTRRATEPTVAVAQENAVETDAPRGVTPSAGAPVAVSVPEPVALPVLRVPVPAAAPHLPPCDDCALGVWHARETGSAAWAWEDLTLRITRSGERLVGSLTFRQAFTGRRMGIEVRYPLHIERRGDAWAFVSERADDMRISFGQFDESQWAAPALFHATLHVGQPSDRLVGEWAFGGLAIDSADFVRVARD